MAKFKEIIVKSINLVGKTYIDNNGNEQPFQPLDIYLVPVLDGNLEHDRYVVDNNVIISKQAKSEDGNFIALTGTEQNKPLTHPIQYVQNSITDATIYSGSLEGGQVGALSFGSDNDVRLSNGYTQGGGTSGMNIVQLNTENIQISSTTMTGTYTSNVYLYPNSIVINSSDINISGSSVAIGALPNAQGDPTFTRQIVQKDDGTLGFIKSSIAPVRKPLISPNNTVVGDAFLEIVGNMAFVQFNIESVTIDSGSDLSFQTIDGFPNFLTTNKTLKNSEGQELLVRTNSTSYSIVFRNQGDTQRFRIHETFVFFTSDDQPS